jgi:hypothetical protein
MDSIPYIKMYHFETIDPKTKKNLTFEDENLKTILKTVLNHENGKKNNDDSDVVFEDAVGNILQTVSEKYLKHILGMSTIRETAKLKKSSETFKKLNQKEIATITFKNACHDGVITIWEESNENCYEGLDTDDELERELEEAMNDYSDEESDEEPIKVSKKDTKKDTKKETKIVKDDKYYKNLEDENKKLKEQVEILKSFVSKYREMSLNINKEVINVIKFE